MARYNVRTSKLLGRKWTVLAYGTLMTGKSFNRAMKCHKAVIDVLKDHFSRLTSKNVIFKVCSLEFETKIPLKSDVEAIERDSKRGLRYKKHQGSCWSCLKEKQTAGETGELKPLNFTQKLPLVSPGKIYQIFTNVDNEFWSKVKTTVCEVNNLFNACIREYGVSICFPSFLQWPAPFSGQGNLLVQIFKMIYLTNLITQDNPKSICERCQVP